MLYAHSLVPRPRFPSHAVWDEATVLLVHFQCTTIPDTRPDIHVVVFTVFH